MMYDSCMKSTRVPVEIFAPEGVTVIDEHGAYAGVLRPGGEVRLPSGLTFRMSEDGRHIQTEGGKRCVIETRILPAPSAAVEVPNFSITS